MTSVTTEVFTYYKHTGGFKELTEYKCRKTNPPVFGFFLGGASSSDEESSLLDSAAAAGFADTGLTGAY